MFWLGHTMGFGVAAIIGWWLARRAARAQARLEAMRIAANQVVMTQG